MKRAYPTFSNPEGYQPSPHFEMRGNKKVYGDWQVSYSNWKDYIISLQKETAGYTDEELKVINEKTAAFKGVKVPVKLIIDTDTK